MRKVFPSQIDPERVRFQLDLLASAIWKNAEREVRRDLREAEAVPTHPKGLTRPLTISSKTP